MNKGLLVFAITLLVNPCVNVFDYLPDFIGYWIIASALTFYAKRVPHFEEARTAFLRLSCVSLAKIPAYLFIVLIRGENTVDNDIKSLFTFSLTAIEAILLVAAIKHLFDALSYLGQRGCATALIKDFPISKKKNRTASPDALRVLCYVFAVYKFLATAIPEMLLLTKTVDAGSYYTVFNVAKLYPYAIIFSVVSVFVLGIIVTKRFSRYLSAIKNEGLMRKSVDGMLDDLSRISLDKKLKVEKIKTTLNLLLIATFFTADIKVSNLLNVDAIPNFVFGILVILASVKMTEIATETKSLTTFAAIYSSVALVAYYFQVRFMSEFGFESLTRTIAKNEYITVMAAYAIEFALYCALFVLMRAALSKLAINHTGIDTSNPNHSRLDEEYRKKLQTDVWIWFSLGILSGAAKLADTILRYFSTETLVAAENGVSVITTGLIPWFGLVVSGTTVAFILYSLNLIGKLKEEVALKYS